MAQGAESPKVSASNTIKATVNPKRQIHGVPRSCMVRPGRGTIHRDKLPLLPTAVECPHISAKASIISAMYPKSGLSFIPNSHVISSRRRRINVHNAFPVAPLRIKFPNVLPQSHTVISTMNPQCRTSRVPNSHMVTACAGAVYRTVSEQSPGTVARISLPQIHEVFTTIRAAVNPKSTLNWIPCNHMVFAF